MRAKVRQLVEIINSGVQPFQNIPVLAMIDDFKQDRKKWAAFWIRRGLSAFEDIVKDTRGQYCTGDQVSLADVFLYPQAISCARFDIDLSEFKNIKEIFDNLNKLPEVQMAHADHMPDAKL